MSVLVLVLGLAIFLGLHSIRIFADDWRNAQVGRIGLGRYKGLYSIVAAVGLVLVIWGYGMSREAPVDLWYPPGWTRWPAAALMVVSFILFVAADLPGTRIKSALGHPMMIGTKVWAFAHLISNGRLGDVLLFGAFLAWAVAGFASARRRDSAAGTRRPPGRLSRDALAAAVGVAASAVFILWLHGWLIGVRPLP